MANDLLPVPSADAVESTLKEKNPEARGASREMELLADLSRAPRREELLKPGKLIDFLEHLTMVGDGYRKYLYFVLSGVFVAGKTIVDVDEAWKDCQSDHWWHEHAVAAPKKQDYKAVFKSLLRRSFGNRDSKILNKYRSLLLDMVDEAVLDEHAMEEVEKRGIEKGSYRKEKVEHDRPSPAPATVVPDAVTFDPGPDEAAAEPLDDPTDSGGSIADVAKKHLLRANIDGKFEILIKPTSDFIEYLAQSGPAEVSFKISVLEGGEITLSDTMQLPWAESTRSLPSPRPATSVIFGNIGNGHSNPRIVPRSRDG